ncbi:hypothetical protein D3C72_1631100 [compost metagenome]
MFVTEVRPGNLNLGFREIRTVAVDVIGWDIKRRKKRFYKKINASARDIEGNVLAPQISQEFTKAFTYTRLTEHKLGNLFTSVRRHQGEHGADTLVDRQLTCNNLLHDRLVALWLEMLHNRYDIVADCNGSVEITKDDGF